MARRVRLVLLLLVGVVVLFALSDALGLRQSSTSVRSPLGYVEISHGSHSHYVPNGWTGEPGISDFPTSPPPPGMTVGPTGEVVPRE